MCQTNVIQHCLLLLRLQEKLAEAEARVAELSQQLHQLRMEKVSWFVPLPVLLNSALHHVN